MAKTYNPRPGALELSSEEILAIVSSRLKALQKAHFEKDKYYAKFSKSHTTVPTSTFAEKTFGREIDEARCALEEAYEVYVEQCIGREPDEK